MRTDRSWIWIDLELVESLRALGLTDEMIANYYGMTEEQFWQQLIEQVQSNDPY